MGLRLYTAWLICLNLAGPALGTVGLSSQFQSVSCPDAVLHCLVRDFSLDAKLAKNELLPALSKVVRNGRGVPEEGAWAHWPVNGSREQADRVPRLRGRVLTRLNGIAHDLAHPSLQTLVMAVRGEPAQLETLDALQSLDPSAQPAGPRPAWKVRPAHLIGGTVAALVGGGTACLLCETSLNSGSWVAGAAGLVWLLGHSAWDHEFALQRFYNPPAHHPESLQFFLDLGKHRELVSHPTHKGDWIYNAINFEQHRQPLLADLFTHVTESDTGEPKSVTWLILRRP